MEKATHEGILKIGNIKIRCYVLEDGTRVLSRIEAIKAIGRTGKAKGGRQYDNEFNLPVFLTAKNLKPFITSNIVENSAPVIFKQKSGETIGYKAELLPQICGVFLDADSAGVIQANQRHIVERVKVLIRGLATIGITALVDEATGYQEIRKKDALAKLLEKWIEQETYRKWTKTFPIQFYEEIFRLRGWDMLNPKRQRPGVLSKYTDNFVYKRIAPELLELLRKKNPIIKTGRRAAKHHQWLTGDVGEPRLRAHLEAVIALMKISNNWNEFIRNINRVYPRYDEHPDLPFTED